jgi:hypothetical protein
MLQLDPALNRLPTFFYHCSWYPCCLSCSQVDSILVAVVLAGSADSLLAVVARNKLFFGVIVSVVGTTTTTTIHIPVTPKLEKSCTPFLLSQVPSKSYSPILQLENDNTAFFKTATGTPVTTKEKDESICCHVETFAKFSSNTISSGVCVPLLFQ